ncbi:hypothetical protein A8C32_19015 [Flavivirga aquatica]|uniref:Uncharacterized protein n=1 Tax=Flavivirga aquatica TaxID=1849968 RepID=A0A1E5T403_9FLAO|nr:hypothetical protein [Flavivirga aquatica]OEK06123.1 hypothetical protein A8C32_19015 [Flavivirga aquatica]
MIIFENIKSQWENQSELMPPKNGSKLIIERITFIKKKQRITNVILSITGIILIAFFFYIAAYNNVLVAVALLLMLGSLLVRIIIEQFSIKKLKQIKVTISATAFKQEMINYYRKRIRTHYIITPIVIVCYAIGFIILLPFFKESLSNGFYTYIQVSSIVILVVLTLFIIKEV